MILMRFEYTHHVEEKIAERRLNKTVIEEVLLNPDKTTNAKFGRKITQRTIGNKVLRIIYEEKQDAYIIITAYYTEVTRYGGKS
ncbi:hypothetical protein B2A_13518 [mine drainage metagenome]|uniref:DUF4258 domain-containing protein n=1 Tax=mine drainage metagenome TaxID=410659 RepID=T0YBB5_9ZZZZ